MTESEGETRPFIDNVFDALADWRRREICRYFRETDATTASVGELALIVEGGRPPEAESADPDHAEVAADLRERHLPRLDAAGVVDYDDRSETVRYWGQATVEKWLEHVDAVDHYES